MKQCDGLTMKSTGTPGRVAGFMIATFVSVTAGAEPSRSGQEVYEKVCSLCHEKHVATELRSRQLPQELIRIYVRQGMNGMPPFRVTEISDDELSNLIQFLQHAPESGK